jgi:hypothetical protein
MWRRSIVINDSYIVAGSCAVSTPSNRSANCRYFDKRFGKQSASAPPRCDFWKEGIAIEIIANKLPDSHRLYLTRHNDELKKNAQAVRLAQARAK